VHYGFGISQILHPCLTVCVNHSQVIYQGGYMSAKFLARLILGASVFLGSVWQGPCLADSEASFQSGTQAGYTAGTQASYNSTSEGVQNSSSQATQGSESSSAVMSGMPWDENSANLRRAQETRSSAPAKESTSQSATGASSSPAQTSSQDSARVRSKTTNYNWSKLAQ
jgi:hypothetical protein